MNKEQQSFRRVGEKCISVCMFCFPADSIFKTHPELKGNAISHGCCNACKVKFLADLAKG